MLINVVVYKESKRTPDLIRRVGKANGLELIEDSQTLSTGFIDISVPLGTDLLVAIANFRNSEEGKIYNRAWNGRRASKFAKEGR